MSRRFDVRQVRPVAVAVLLLSGCLESGSESETDSGPPLEPPLTSYSNCRPGCPDDHHCVGWYDQGYCTRRCRSDDDCTTGCCSETSSGVRACGPLYSCLSRCDWSLRGHCVTATLGTATGCTGTTGMAVDYRNDCAEPVRVYSCITDRDGTWACEPDSSSDGLAFGETFTHTFCRSGGRSRYWATDIWRVTEECPWPLPVP